MIFIKFPIVLGGLLFIPAVISYGLMRKGIREKHLDLYKFLMTLDYIGISLIFIGIFLMLELAYSIGGWGLTLGAIVVEGYLMSTVIYGIKTVVKLKV